MKSIWKFYVRIREYPDKVTKVIMFKQFYGEYQPWITLVYIAIFLGTVIGFFLAI